MNVKAGDIIVVRHYSLLNVFKCQVVEVGETTIALKISREQSNAYFLSGDPIVLAYLNADNLKTTGGRVNFHNSSDAILSVC